MFNKKDQFIQKMAVHHLNTMVRNNTLRVGRMPSDVRRVEHNSEEFQLFK